MKDEIKLWKEKTKGLFHIIEYTRFWNYITNLQEENKRLQTAVNNCKQRINNAIEYIKENEKRIWFFRR